MTQFPKKLQEKLARRELTNSLRHLPITNSLVDFTSNDYLGLAANPTIMESTLNLLSAKRIEQNGATGSRLLSGNHLLYNELEAVLADFHETESALVFNSGYDANIGFFSAVPQRGDIVFYDEYVHASIRDGIKMGNAKSIKFKHNDLEDLKTKCSAELGRGHAESVIYVVTESVFSMDGDSPDLEAFAIFSRQSGCLLIVDEAHAVGVFGEKGEGLVQQMDLNSEIFARIITFGKALGCHGAAIVGGRPLKDYLVNFARSLIYTTGLPPHSVASILAGYAYLKGNGAERIQLDENKIFFDRTIEELELKTIFIPSNSAIRCCIISGNAKVRSIANELQHQGYDLRPILSPTVPEGKERLRICLHSFTSKVDIRKMLEALSKLIV